MLKLQRLLKILVCCVMVAAFAGCASETGTTKKESTGEYVDDSVITTKVKSALAGDPTVKATQVNVKTYQGTVQLSGFVDSQESVKKAGEIARRVEGVKQVKNDIHVK